MGIEKVDLHIHSHFSDGELSPLEILRIVSGSGISVFSITDHNVLIGDSDLVRKAAERTGVRYVEGIEVSCIDRETGESLHLLGYSRRFDRKMMGSGLNGTIDGYNLRARGIIDRLNREFPGIDLDFEPIHSSRKEAYTTRNTLARMLVDFVGGSMTLKEALKNHVWIKEDDSWMLSSNEALELIRTAGGCPVLAHSERIWKRLGDESYENLIDRLVTGGLGGLETSYPRFSGEDESFLVNFAGRKGLIMTGGSDWHGPHNTPDVRLGREMAGERVEDFLRAIGG
ncbi:PHP domain-containing protein [Candidatus Uhrbacteria bacterium]|nr:PHP domain-containing protein [Candidatus Uhrbacteria bacterium]